MTVRLLVAALLATGGLPGAAQTLRPTAQAMRVAQCDQDRAKAADAGWDVSTIHLTCEPRIVGPVRTREAKPQYTPDAMRAKIQGWVMVSAVVDTDGVIRDARVTKSLDTTFGLDEQALKAVRAMTFVPGRLDGKPVRTLVTFDLQFTLR